MHKVSFRISACADVAGYRLRLIFVTVVRNEVEDGFKESTPNIQIHAVSPQGKIKNQFFGNLALPSVRHRSRWIAPTPNPAR